MYFPQNNAYIDALDIHCRTPLMLAVACHLPEATITLLNAGADLTLTDIENNTALHLAYAYGSMSCVEILEVNGANSDVRNVVGRIPSEELARQDNLLPLLKVSNTKKVDTRNKTDF